TIDGTKVFEGELSDPGRGLRYNRVMANRFMALAADQTQMNLLRHAVDQKPRMSPQGQKIIDQIQLTIENNPQMVPFLAQFLGRDLESMVSSPTAKAEDKEAARAILAMFALVRSRVSNEHYFLNAPNRTSRDLVNFLLWQKKADQLGIKLTTDDVKKLVQKEFHDFFLSDAPITKHLRESMTGFNIDRCLAAIGEEFRVRMAQVAVLGPGWHGGRPDKTFGGAPVF